MEPQPVAEIAKRLATALENTQESNSVRLSRLDSALAALAANMEPQAAAEIAKGLTAALDNVQTTDFSRLDAPFAALAAKTKPRTAEEIAKGLVLTLENSQDKDSKRFLASLLSRALAALAANMERKAAAEIARQAGQCLTTALQDTQKTDFDGLSRLGQALAAVAANTGTEALRRLLCGLWEAAEPHTLALANRARANADFETITLPSEVALFKEQPAGGALG
jgi:hypothetical protein